MPAELLTSKLSIPPLRRSLVPRPRLMQLLNEGLHAGHRLTLISAPAGFGKTTLVVDWLKEMDLAAAWLSLEEGDNALPRFLLYLAAAFQQVDEEIGAPVLSALQSPRPPPVEKILTGLLNEIALRDEPLILVLDDLHMITEAAILEAMRFLLDHLPPRLHLLLTTREDPDLPLARLRARDQLTEIRARDLRFSRVEADTFLRGVMGLALSEQDVAALEGRTEGWAAGLQLAGLSMEKHTDLKAFIAEFSGSHRHILDYLTEEVLEQQPEEIRMFMLQTSVLDRLSAGLCDALTGREDSDQVLAHLEAANLFVIPLDEERRWYRYHHLFADLLRSQLIRSERGLIPGLHRRASRWYEANGDIRAAVDHALQDNDLTQAARLIEQHTFAELYRGHVAAVLGWFDRLPEAALGSAPMLCIGKAWALAVMERGPRPGELEQALQAASRALEQVSADTGLRDLVAGHTASIRAFSMEASVAKGGGPESTIALAREARRLLPQHEKGIRSVTSLSIGGAHLALGDLAQARLAFQQVLDDGLAGGNYYAGIYGPIHLASLAILGGDLPQALQLCETNIERFNRIAAGQYFPPIGALYVLKGSILVEYDRLAEAEKSLTEGLELVRWTGETIAHRKGYRALARLRAIQGDRSAMLEALKTLEETFPDATFLARAWGHCLSLRHWPEDADVRKEAQIWLRQTGIEFDRLPVTPGIEPGSEDYFEGSICAAHVLARLATERKGAYPMEDVHDYLRRQGEFAETHRMRSRAVAAAIARTLLYQAAGRKKEALEVLAAALRAAAPTGLLRVFLDDCQLLRDLLEEIAPRLTEQAVSAYTTRLLEACGRLTKPESGEKHEALLSERELEVLRCLAGGSSYEEIGRQLFLSLNTIQFHVKNIYRKLLVSKRTHAIEKARELHLI